MLRIKKIDHVAICVADTDEAIAKYKQVLGIDPEVREIVASQQTEATLLPICLLYTSTSRALSSLSPRTRIRESLRCVLR